MPKNSPHAFLSLGIDRPSAASSVHKARAAMPTRRTTIVSGVSSLTATATKKNELPHSTESAMSIAHSSGPMVLFIVVGFIAGGFRGSAGRNGPAPRQPQPGRNRLNAPPLGICSA